MKIMSAVLESRVKACVESPCKALNGNQDTPGIETRHLTSTKWINGIARYDSGLQWGNFSPLPYPGDDLDRYRKDWELYSEQRDIQVWNSTHGDISYDGHSAINGAGQVPSVVGKPDHLQHFYEAPDGVDHWIGIGDEFAGSPPINYDNFLTLDSTSPTSVVWDFSGFDFSGPISQQINITLSGLINVASVYNQARNDFLAAQWDHYWPLTQSHFPYQTGGIVWNEFHLGRVGGAVHVGVPNQASYNGAQQRLNVNSGAPFIRGITCMSGWDINAGVLNMIRGSLHLNQIATPTNGVQTYFIGRWRGGPQVLTGSGLWHFRIDIIGGGIVNEPDTNYAAGINPFVSDPSSPFYYEVPFPGSAPFPIAGFFTQPVIQDYNFCVIGQSAAGWAAANGYVLGDNFA